MPSDSSTIVVFGSGPGIGSHVAAEFAAQGYPHVILLARSEARLPADKAFIESKVPGVKVSTLTVDLSDTASIAAVLRQIDSLTDQVELVFFNAARIKATSILNVPAEELEEDFRTTTVALYVVAQWAIPKLQALAKEHPSAKPGLLVTSSFLPHTPIPDLLSLSLVKAAQRNMVQNFDVAFAGSGVKFEIIKVNGAVAPGNKHLNPSNIAKVTWNHFSHGKGLEVDINE